MSSKKRIRKEEKVNRYSSDSEEASRMIKILIGVVVVLAVFYLIFALITGEISFGKKEKAPAEIQNIEILAGNTFLRPEGTYYVLMYDFSKTDSIIYANIYDLYSNNSGAKMYLVDLSKKFNTQYLVEDKSAVKVNNINNLKVVNGTLIKIENGVGVSYSVGEENIRNTLFGN